MRIAWAVFSSDKPIITRKDFSFCDTRLEPCFGCQDDVWVCIFKHTPKSHFLWPDTLEVNGENPYVSVRNRLASVRGWRGCWLWLANMLMEWSDRVVKFFETLSLVSKSSNRLVSKVGMPHLKQHQLTSLFSRASYVAVFMCIQSLWYHSSQLLQATESIVFDHLQAFPHIWHGNFGVRGPSGLGWQSCDCRMTSLWIGTESDPGINWNLAFCMRIVHAYTHKTFEMHVQLEKWSESGF